MKALTEKQAIVFKEIKGFIKLNGYSPTCKELADLIGYPAVNSIYEHLAFIEKKGYIKRTPKIARSIVVLEK
jgi:repressor LexA